VWEVVIEEDIGPEVTLGSGADVLPNVAVGVVRYPAV
jgi:hypothetical protein